MPQDVLYFLLSLFFLWAQVSRVLIYYFLGFRLCVILSLSKISTYHLYNYQHFCATFLESFLFFSLHCNLDYLLWKFGACTVLLPRSCATLGSTTSCSMGSTIVASLSTKRVGYLSQSSKKSMTS